MNDVNVTPPADECDTLREYIAEYAFGLTDAEDTRRVEAGLADCAGAAQELAEYRQIQDALRSAVPQITPPASLREKLMAATAPIQTASPAPAPARPVKTASFNRAWLAAAAAVALLVITNLFWLMRATAPETTPLENNAFVLSSTSSLRWVRLPAENTETQSAAFLMWNAASTTGLMYAVNLPPLQQGRVYELWLTRDGERVSVGTFNVDDGGEAALIFHAIDPIDNFQRAWVTEEPAGGAPQPSNNIIARGEL